MVNPNNSQLLKLVYLPGLNGLRAIAALAVVISHITLSLNEFGLNNKIFGTDKAGNASGLIFRRIWGNYILYFKWLFDYISVTQRKRTDKAKNKGILYQACSSYLAVVLFVFFSLFNCNCVL